ncbi:MAG: 50S ribosomal protein L3 [Armatimonadetes bacterium]|nr:50S ribosomal protein L3 [Armatimonadota bacterium]
MKGLIGRKVGMTHLYGPAGNRIAVTVIQAGPCVVTQQKTAASDGYEALQLAFDPVLDEQQARELAPEQRERRISKRVNKPQRRHFEKAGVAAHRVMREVRVEAAGDVAVGTVLTADLFAAGELVDVVGTSKGKGFAGSMRRHNFSGQGASHGAKIHRKPASAGATDAARVFKGKRSPGHLGHDRVTVKNLVVEMVDAAANVIAVRGAVPGPRGALVMVLGEE